MANNCITIFNRQQHLKNWQPLPELKLHLKNIRYYNQKIYNHCKNEGGRLSPYYLMELEANNPTIDATYIKYIAIQHIKNLIQYINSKNIKLNDIEGNIRQILDEIIKGDVSESYYTNTMDIYDSINGNSMDELDLYGIVNQAIRLDNKRLLYYIIFRESEDLTDRIYELIGE